MRLLFQNVGVSMTSFCLKYFGFMEFKWVTETQRLSSSLSFIQMGHLTSEVANWGVFHTRSGDDWIRQAADPFTRRLFFAHRTSPTHRHDPREGKLNPMTDGRLRRSSLPLAPTTPPDGRVYLCSVTKCNPEGGIRGIVAAILQGLNAGL